MSSVREPQRKKPQIPRNLLPNYRGRLRKRRKKDKKNERSWNNKLKRSTITLQREMLRQRSLKIALKT